jgi:hypothetical protein
VFDPDELRAKCSVLQKKIESFFVGGHFVLFDDGLWIFHFSFLPAQTRTFVLLLFLFFPKPPPYRGNGMMKVWDPKDR